MAVNVYYSTDGSAPTLNQSPGSLIGILDACLLNGYGSKSAAGWDKAFTGTNVAAYRAPAGNRHYLRVDDTPTGSARWQGYESMTDVDTGTGPFPTSAQLSGGVYIYHGANTSPHHWMLLASDKFFYLFVVPGNVQMPAASYCYGCAFGDIISYKSGDAYHTILAGGPAAPAQSNVFGLGNIFSGAGASSQGHYMARSHTQIGAAIGVGKTADQSRGVSNGIFASGSITPYPDPITGGMLMSVVPVMESVGARGHMPGLWQPLHATPASPLDTFTGTGTLAGKTFQIVNPHGYAGGTSYGSRLIVEISDTWE